SSNNDLRTYELRYAFSRVKEVNSGLKLDLVGFDACRMGLLEVDYQLVDYADIAIGSEKDVEWDGLPYDMVLGRLVSSPSMSPRELSEMVVHEYVESYRNGSVDSGDYAITLSAVDLGALNSTLNQAFEEFSREVSLSMPYFKAKISAVRGSTERYEGNQFFDLYHFAQLCAQEGNLSREIRVAAGEVMDAIGDCVIAEDHWNPANPKQGYAHNAHGISFYFDDIALHPDYRGFVISERTDWDEFLDRYYGGRPMPSTSLSADISIYNGDGTYGNDTVDISFHTNKTALNLTVNVYDSVGEHVATLFNESTFEGIEGGLSFYVYDYGTTSDYYTFSVSLANSSGILQNYTEFSEVWLGNERPDVLVTDMTFFRGDGTLVGGDSGKHPVANETTTITARIMNSGSENLTEIGIGLFDGDEKISQQSVSLDVGEEERVDFDWIAANGTHHIRLVADFDRQVREVDEENNEVSEAIEVISPRPLKSLVIKGNVTTVKNETLSGVKVVAINQRTQQVKNGTVDNATFTIILYPDWYLNGDNVTVKATYEDKEIQTSFDAYSEDKRKYFTFTFEKEDGEDFEIELVVLVLVCVSVICLILAAFLKIKKGKGASEPEETHAEPIESEPKKDD
ncbi:MAG: hypothetical protein JSW28_07830, partial [Thermoplasmata archaeon]